MKLLEITPTQIKLFRAVRDVFPDEIEHRYTTPQRRGWKFGDKGTYFSADEKSNEMYFLSGGGNFKIQIIYEGVFSNLLTLSEEDLKGLSKVGGFDENRVTVTKQGSGKLNLKPGTTLSTRHLKYPPEYDGIFFAGIGDVFVPENSSALIKPIQYVIGIHEWLKKQAQEIATKLNTQPHLERGELGKLVSSLAGDWLIPFKPNQVNQASALLRKYAPTFDEAMEKAMKSRRR